MTETPCLTGKPAAPTLGISDDRVRKLIRRDLLRAIKCSKRHALIPRPAYNAYARQLGGDPPRPLEMPATGRALAERAAAVCG